MRRTLLFLTLFLSGWVGKMQGADLPYSFDFSDQTVFDTDWTVLNVNGDNKTWNIVASDKAAKYSWSTANNADDWMISPAFHLEPGVEYKLSYQLKTSSATNEENVKVMLGNDITPEAMTTELAKYENYADVTYRQQTIVFHVEEAGDYYIGFYCYSIKDRYAVFIKDFSLKLNGMIPMPVTGLTVTPDPGQVLKATVSWTNPTLDIYNNELSADVTSATIYRDGSEVATVTGLTNGSLSSWVDEEVPKAGIHSYGVEVRLNDEKSERITVTSEWIGAPVQPMPVPYSFDFSDAETFASDWRVIDVNQDTKTWTLDASQKQAKYSYNGSMSADDWMVTPPLYLEAGIEYKISYSLKTGNFNEKLEVMLGSAPTPEGLGSVLAKYDPYKNSTAFEKMNVLARVEVSGNYYIAFHCYSDRDMFYLYVSDFSIKPNIAVPAPVIGLEIEAASDKSLSAVVSWINPSTDTDGLPLGTSLTSATIYRDDAEVATVTGLTNGAPASWTDTEVPLAGFHEYGVKVTLGNVSSMLVTANSPWIGPLEAVALPYTCDFEDPLYFGIWKVVPPEGSVESWALYEDGANRTVRYAGTAGQEAADGLYMPPVNFEADKYYRLKYDIKGNGNYRVSMSGPGTIDIEPRVLEEATGFAQSGFARKEIVITVVESGHYYIGWLAFGQQDAAWQIDLDNVSVEEMAVLPVHIQDLTITPDAGHLKRAELSWTNPSVTNVGTPLAELVSVDVYRNGVLIGSVADPVVGAVASYVDSVIPESGTYVYQVVPVNDAGAAEGDAPEVVSAWIGGGATLPYAMGFSPDEDFSVWTVIDNNNDGKTWGILKDGTEYYANYKGVYRDADDWLITPPLDMTAGKFYRLTYRVKGKGHEKYKVTIGTYHSVDAQTTVIADYPSFSETNFVDRTEFVSVPESGMYFIAWQAYSPSGEWNVDVDDIRLEESLVVPRHVQDLTVTPAADKSLSAVLSWTNPSETNVGAPLTALNAVYVYRNEEMIGTLENPQPGAVETYTDVTVPVAGAYIYKVIPETVSGLPEGDPIEVRSGWIGGGITLPYETGFTSDDDIAFWTIADANNDSKVWKRDGSKNEMQYASYSVADDWLISLPLEGVSGVHKISFTVKTGVGFGSVPSNFDFTFGGSPDPAGHDSVLVAFPSYQSGLYEEKSVEFNLYTDTVFYIGLHLKTNVNNNGEMFYVNNFKAERTGPLVGIADVTALHGMVYNRINATLRVPASTLGVTVYNTEGRPVYNTSARETAYDLSTLSAGLYIVRIRMENGTERTMKIVR